MSFGDIVDDEIEVGEVLGSWGVNTVKERDNR